MNMQKPARDRGGKPLLLTADLVARVTLPVEDSGLDPALTYNTDEDFDQIVDGLMATHPAGQDLWLFACGSLIWRPACAVAEHKRATLHGWHRSFCLKITRWRATKECPGLMMALDRGGQCDGVAFRVPAAETRESLNLLVRRESSMKPSNNVARWVSVRAGATKHRALAFVMNRQSRFYTGRLAPEAAADLLSHACGHMGSCAEYLHNTVVHLAEFGIYDRNLWELQALVAERIGAVRASRPLAATRTPA
jgi:glutathione-specific gamma-glutamylcyclotransferase